MKPWQEPGWKTRDLAPKDTRSKYRPLLCKSCRGYTNALYDCPEASCKRLQVCGWCMERHQEGHKPAKVWTEEELQTMTDLMFGKKEKAP